MTAKQYFFYLEPGNTKNTFLWIILCVYIFHSIFNKNESYFQYVYRRSRCREALLKFLIGISARIFMKCRKYFIIK